MVRYDKDSSEKSGLLSSDVLDAAIESKSGGFTDDDEAHADDAMSTSAAPRLTLSPTARERMTLARNDSLVMLHKSMAAHGTYRQTVNPGTLPSNAAFALDVAVSPQIELMQSSSRHSSSGHGGHMRAHPSSGSPQQAKAAKSSASTTMTPSFPAHSGSSSVLQGDVILSGMLTKLGHFFKTWLPRFFILTRQSLSYYKKRPQHGSQVDPKSMRGEICKGDVLKVEATNAFRNRSYTFVVVAKKPLRQGWRQRVATPSCAKPVSCLQKEHGLSSARSGSSGNAGFQGPVVLYYIQANSEEERQKWLKALQRWIEGECLAKIGRRILSYIASNSYNTLRYEQKVSEYTDRLSGALSSSSGTLSPAAQAGRRIEEDFPVLANLIRELYDCEHPDEVVYILDQILGEVKEGAASGTIKKVLAAAAEQKVEGAPQVWTKNAKAAYGKIMMAMSMQTTALAVETRGVSASTKAEDNQRLLLPPAPMRLQSDGGESAPENSFHRHYKLGRKLGSGSYSVVHIATNRRTRKQVAVKCIAKAGLSEQDVESLKEEVRIMAELDHPNLVPLLGYFEEERYYYIVTPLCTGGELFDDLVKRKSYTEEDARELMRKLASAIAYVHSKGIVHRDLKPENILLKTSAQGAEIMIADFGFARSMKGARHGTACGTPGYIAPEVVRGLPYGSEVDCWSLGVIMFILLCGYPPFPGENHAAILDKVVRADYQFESPYWDNVSAEAKDLVQELLNVDREKRLSAVGILSHRWMSPDAHRDDVGKARLHRVNSDLLPVLSQMRMHSLTHERPKILPSDMEVDIMELSQLTIDGDMAMLDEELCNFDDFN